MNSPTTRVALVTGCGKPDGMGQAIAKALAAKGITVMLADVAPTGARNYNERDADIDASWGGVPGLVEQITAGGGRAGMTFGDISVEEDANRMIAETVAQFGRIDILVNNAAAPQEPMVDVEDVQMADWDRVIAVNLRGTFLMCRAAIPRMRENGWGRIVNISSMSARVARARRSAYAASKTGILGLTRALATETARDGITVNAVLPGQVRTSRSISSARRDGDVEAELRKREAQILVGRFGTGVDIANAVVWLVAEESSFVTGQDIGVDGGGGHTQRTPMAVHGKPTPS
jgi:3-oxoacyl-[acyl-carrier protein] reductase